MYNLWNCLLGEFDEAQSRELLSFTVSNIFVTYNLNNQPFPFSIFPPQPYIILRMRNKQKTILKTYDSWISYSRFMFRERKELEEY
jgi:hypothetical protein